MKVLLAQEDLNLMKFFRMVLTSEGYEVESVESGDKAWKLYQQEPFPMVLLDWNLPGMGGVDLSQKIRNHSLGERTVILLFTDRNHPEDLEKALDAGIDDYLLKPLDMARMKIRLKIARKKVRDAWGKQNAQEALEASEEKFRTMADDAPVLIWISDRDGQFNFFNQRWLNFTGRSMKEELVTPWEKTLHPQDLSIFLETYRKAYKSYQPFLIEFQLRRLDGQYRWFLNTSLPRFEKNGYFGGYVGSCIDITDRKIVENQLIKERESALEALRLKSEVLAHLTQESRTSLKIILEQASILAETPLSPAQRKSLEIIQKSGHGLQKILNEIADLPEEREEYILATQELKELAHLPQNRTKNFPF